jgi:hypothetical protein
MKTEGSLTWYGLIVIFLSDLLSYFSNGFPNEVAHRKSKKYSAKNHETSQHRKIKSERSFDLQSADSYLFLNAGWKTYLQKPSKKSRVRVRGVRKCLLDL